VELKARGKNDDEGSTVSRRDQFFGSRIRSNRGAQGWQAGEAGKAVATNGLNELTPVRVILEK